MNRTPVTDQPTVDHVRGFPNAYEMDAFGGTYGTQPENAWQRGDLERAIQPVLSLRPPLPMYDPSMLRDPNAWHHGDE